MNQQEVRLALDDVERRFAVLDAAYSLEVAGYEAAKLRGDLGAMIEYNERSAEIAGKRRALMPRFMWLVLSKEPS